MEIPAITFPMFGENFVLDFLPYFTIFGWKFYWYGLIIAVGFLLAVIYGVRRAKSFGLTEDNLIDMLIWAVPLAIVGARLYYVAFYRDGDGTNPYFDGSGDFLEIIKIWEGGLAIYGGVIGGILGLAISARLQRISAKAMLDLSALGLLIGQAIGRWGNFTNREAHGIETRVPWRMGLQYSFKTFYYHPTFLYESLWNVLGFLLLHFMSKKRRKYDGQLFLMYIAWYGLGRAIIEGLRTDSLFVGQSNLRVSQLIAILTFLAAACLMLYIRFFKHPEPEDLWVNRDIKEQILAQEQADKARKDAEAAEADFDDELSDAFRILSAKSGFDDSQPETLSEEPVVAPVDYQIASAVPDEEEAPEKPKDGTNEQTGI